MAMSGKWLKLACPTWYCTDKSKAVVLLVYTGHGGLMSGCLTARVRQSDISSHCPGSAKTHELLLRGKMQEEAKRRGNPQEEKHHCLLTCPLVPSRASKCEAFDRCGHTTQASCSLC